MSYDDFDYVLDSLDRSIEEINRQYNIPDYDACVDCRYFENIHYDIFGSKTRNYCTKKKGKLKHQMMLVICLLSNKSEVNNGFFQ